MISSAQDLFAPIPVAAMNAARAGVVRRGFAPDAILERYPLLTATGTHTINAIAFAHPTRRDLSGHAGVTISSTNRSSVHLPNERVRILAQSTAPFHIVHDNSTHRFSFHATSIEGEEVRALCLADEIAYDGLDGALAEFKADLRPDVIVNVKQGLEAFSNPTLRALRPLQLSLWVEDVTRRLLRERFSQAIELLRTSRTDRRRLPSRDVTRLAIQLLGAIVLADTGGLGSLEEFKSADLHRLIEKAHAAFPRYFETDLFRQHQLAADGAYKVLRGLGYGGFTPDMLTDLYNAAYDEKAKRELGRYDTPLYLTRRLWQSIPVEFLPPEQRIIADMTCGWGSFLIAGHERLSRLSDMGGRTLRDHLFGNDNDSFTALLAGLALLLSSCEDSWNIDSGDALKWRWLDRGRPHIIVGNPPFSGDRKTEAARQDRLQKADAFLLHAISCLSPGGFLAMVMPRSFPVAEASHEVRKTLLEKCDILEMWELPTEVFRGASGARTVAIIAQKKSQSGLSAVPVRVRTVQKSTLTHFKADGRFSSSTLAVDQSRWGQDARKSKGSKNDYLFDYQLILDESAWSRIRARCSPLEDFAVMTQGCIPGDPSKGSWHQFRKPRLVPWLPDAKSALRRPMQVDYSLKTSIRYPNDLQWPRKDRLHPDKDWERRFMGEKVIMTSVLEPGWDMQVRVAVERQGFFVPDNFMVLVPSPRTRNPHSSSVEVIAAVLSFRVAKAWLLEFMKSPKVPMRALRTLPVPPLSDSDCERLVEAVRSLERVSGDSPKDAERHLFTIDTVLSSAYELEGEVARRLNVVSTWGKAETFSLEPCVEKVEEAWVVSGIVMDVDPRAGYVSLWLDGFDGEQRVPIYSSMPGWMLRQGAAFRAHIPYTWRVARRIHPEARDFVVQPQPLAYLDDAELVSDLPSGVIGGQ